MGVMILLFLENDLLTPPSGVSAGGGGGWLAGISSFSS